MIRRSTSAMIRYSVVVPVHPLSLLQKKSMTIVEIRQLLGNRE